MPIDYFPRSSDGEIIGPGTSARMRMCAAGNHAPCSAQAAAQTLQEEQGEMADWFHMPASRVVVTRPPQAGDEQSSSEV